MNPRPLSTFDGSSLPLSQRLEIDSVCDRFEAAWRDGDGLEPDLAEFLGDAEGPARDRLFAELLALDLELRRARGRGRDVEDYLGRFPEHRGAIEGALGRLGDRTRDSAEADPGATIVRAGDEAPAFAGDPAAAAAFRAAGYELLGELGRGGMGVVYRAWQVGLGRVVALKAIKSGEFATSGERRRFQAEAEAVAQLDHPNIVPVYEVGQLDGLPFFSMKLIAGTGLDERLHDYADDPRAAAGLLVGVARAVDHAHRRGLLHRDLKPANILVDERGEAHVTDFGLARRIDGSTDLTHSGAIVGTPSYMSPEQASGCKGSLTTATDVYGLGSVLYAALTGRAPHGGSSLAETLDRVRDEPPKPPSQVNPKVPRDLEVICLKCLEKEPQRRYASAGELADDLRRWLDGEPIAARPVGRLTRTWMWCRRHPAQAALSGSLAAALIAGVAGVTWKWREAEHQRDVLARVEAFWTDRVLAGASTELNPRSAHVTLREVLDLAALRVHGDFVDEPEVEAAIRQTAGEAYRSLGEYPQAEEHLRAALSRNIEAEGRRGRRAIRSAVTLADLLALAEKPDQAEALARETLALARKALGAGDPLTLSAGHVLGAILRRRGRLPEAEALFGRVLAGRRKALPADDPDTLATIYALANVLRALGKMPEAEALSREYEHGIQCARGPHHPDNVTAQANLGRLRLDQGRIPEAQECYRKAWEEARRILGDDHPATLDAESDYALLLLRDADRAGEGVELLRSVVQSAGRVWGDETEKARDARAALRHAERAAP